MREIEMNSHPVKLTLRFSMLFILILLSTITVIYGAGKTWISNGPEGGSVYALAIDPV